MKPATLINSAYLSAIITTWTTALITRQTGWALTALTITISPIIIDLAHNYINTGHPFTAPPGDEWTTISNRTEDETRSRHHHPTNPNRTP